MSYIVMEVQKNSDGSVATITNAYWEKPTDEENRADAEERYHDILKAAAKSPVQYHSAVMIRSEGANFMKNEGYAKNIPQKVTVEDV